MTLVEDRPVLDVPGGRERTMPTRRGTLSSWQFAARLARREVRRRPGRTFLVMLLIALPVFGMTVGSVAVRTSNTDQATEYRRQFGDSDLALTMGEIGPGIPPALQALLPDGSEVDDVFQVYSQISATNADGRLVSPYAVIVDTDADVDGPLAGGLFQLTSGTVPGAPGQAVISPDLADKLDADIGDTIRLQRPDIELQVTGIGRQLSWVDQTAIVTVGFDRELVRPGYGNSIVMVDLPDSMTQTEMDQVVFRLRGEGLSAQSPTQFEWYDDRAADVEALAWGWVAGVVAFIAVGIVIAAAFATSARRQLATIGQLSANGASERLIRRTLGMQGMWTGVLGATFGLIAGVIVMLRSERLFEIIAGNAVSSPVYSVLDLIVVFLTAVVAATCAALVPARSASRIPVLSALAGRRPLSSPPRALVPIGIGLFVGGVFFLAGASTSGGGNFPAAIAVLGSLMVLFGVVCASPLIVAWVGNIGSHLGGVGRLAARSLARSRVRSAGVMTAIATVATLAVVALTATASIRAQDQSTQDEYSIVNANFWQDVSYEPTFDEFGNAEYDTSFDPPPIVGTPFPTDLRATIESILPDATWLEVETVVVDPIAEDDIGSRNLNVATPTIATPAVLDRLDLSDAQQRRLGETGILSLVPYLVGPVEVHTIGGPVVIDLGEPLVPVELDANGNYIDVGVNSFTDVVFSPEFVEQQGFETTVAQVIIDNSTELTRAQRDALNDASPNQGDDAFVDDASAPDAAPSTDLRGSWGFYVSAPSNPVPWALVQAVILGAAMLMVLGVVAIGLSLAASESRDERDVLFTIGAAPKMLRRVAAAKAWVLTTGAAVVAVPVGYVVVKAVTVVNDQAAPFPFVGALTLLLVIPAFVAAASLATSAVAQRMRPVAVSTMTTD